MSILNWFTTEKKQTKSLADTPRERFKQTVEECRQIPKNQIPTPGPGPHSCKNCKRRVPLELPGSCPFFFSHQTTEYKTVNGEKIGEPYCAFHIKEN